MTAVRVLFVCAGCAFVALVIWAATQANFLSSFAMVAADPWGLVSLVDLYLGFAIIAAVIWAVEGGRRAALWIVPLFVLGNVVTALWIAKRLPDLVRALRAPSPEADHPKHQ